MKSIISILIALLISLNTAGTAPAAVSSTDTKPAPNASSVSTEAVKPDTEAPKPVEEAPSNTAEASKPTAEDLPFVAEDVKPSTEDSKPITEMVKPDTIGPADNGPDADGSPDSDPNNTEEKPSDTDEKPDDTCDVVDEDIPDVDEDFTGWVTVESIDGHWRTVTSTYYENGVAIIGTVSVSHIGPIVCEFCRSYFEQFDDEQTEDVPPQDDSNTDSADSEPSPDSHPGSDDASGDADAPDGEEIVAEPQPEEGWVFGYKEPIHGDNADTNVA